MNLILDGVATVLVEWAWKGGLILAVGLILVWLCGRTPARLRARLLGGAMAAALFVPLISAGLALLEPDWGFRVTRQTEMAAFSPTEGGRSEVPPSAGRAWPEGGAGADPVVPEADAVEAPMDFPWARVLAIGWLSVWAGLLLRDGRGRWYLARHLRSLDMLDDGRFHGFAGVDAVFLDSDGNVPWVCRVKGLGNCLVLPAAARRWSDAESRMVLAHELGHIEHGDLRSRRLILWMVAALWFHPLAWISRIVLHRLQEEACDEAVLAAGHGAAAYASLLLGMARYGTPWVGKTDAALAMARPSATGRRIRRVLDGARGGRSAGIRAGAAILVLATAGLGLVSPLLAETAVSQAGLPVDRVEALAYDYADIQIATVDLPLVAGREKEALGVRKLDARGILGPVLNGEKGNDSPTPMGPAGSGMGQLKPPLPSNLPFAPNTTTVGISLGFGPTIHPIKGNDWVHLGADFAGPVGTAVIAPVGGTVGDLGAEGDAGDTGYGNFIGLWVGADNPAAGAYRTKLVFAHLQTKPAFQIGDQVNAGQLIGRLGNSGVSTGAHLHYEVLLYKGEQAVMALDPLGFGAAGLPARLRLATAPD
jgi:hypothetical protein